MRNAILEIRRIISKQRVFFYVHVAYSVTTRKNLMRERLTDGNDLKKIMNLDNFSSKTLFLF